ncbi:hypothetical protein Efla_001815 [Eimeria flavescens]
MEEGSKEDGAPLEASEGGGGGLGLSAGGSPSAAAEAEVLETDPPVSTAAASFHPLKISFYEAVAKQLLDDELHEVAVALCGALHMRANNVLPPDLLFAIFKAAAFQPSADAAAAAAAAAAQRLLLHKAEAPSEGPLPTLGPPGGPPEADAVLRTTPASAAASAEGLFPLGPSRSGIGAGNSQQQQQHQQQRQWQLLRPRAVPPLTEEDQQLVFNPYPPSAEGGGPQGGPPGSPDTRGLEAQVSASIVCSANFKYPCISAACNGDLSLVVGGAFDGSVRLVSVKEQQAATPSGGPSGPPSARSAAGKTRVLLTHEGPVTAVAMGPHSRFCFSGSSDTTVKVFDLNPPRAKASGGLVATLRDVYPVTCVSPHPCGDFLYVGTAHPIVRLYDLNTMRAFASLRTPGALGAPGAPAHQRGPLTDVRPSQDGSVLAAASEDGSIHLFDGVTGHLVNRLPQAHNGMPVTSLRWSRSSRFILSAGSDGQTRIWDIRRGQQVLTFRTGERTDRRVTSVFLQNEAFIASVSGGEAGGALALFSSYTGARVTSFSSPLPSAADRPNAGVCALEASPFNFACVTGSADGE